MSDDTTNQGHNLITFCSWSGFHILLLASIYTAVMSRVDVLSKVVHTLTLYGGALLTPNHYRIYSAMM